MSYIEFYASGYNEKYENGMLCGRDLADRVAQLLHSNVVAIDAGYSIMYSGCGLVLGNDIKPGKWFLRIESSPLVSKVNEKRIIQDIIDALRMETSLTGFASSE